MITQASFDFETKKENKHLTMKDKDMQTTIEMDLTPKSGRLKSSVLAFAPNIPTTLADQFDNIDDAHLRLHSENTNCYITICALDENFKSAQKAFKHLIIVDSLGAVPVEEDKAADVMRYCGTGGDRNKDRSKTAIGNFGHGNSAWHMTDKGTQYIVKPKGSDKIYHSGYKDEDMFTGFQDIHMLDSDFSKKWFKIVKNCHKDSDLVKLIKQGDLESASFTVTYFQDLKPFRDTYAGLRSSARGFWKKLKKDDKLTQTYGKKPYLKIFTHGAGGGPVKSEYKMGQKGVKVFLDSNVTYQRTEEEEFPIRVKIVHNKNVVNTPPTAYFYLNSRLIEAKTMENVLYGNNLNRFRKDIEKCQVEIDFDRNVLADFGVNPVKDRISLDEKLRKWLKTSPEIQTALDRLTQENNKFQKTRQTEHDQQISEKITKAFHKLSKKPITSGEVKEMPSRAENKEKSKPKPNTQEPKEVKSRSESSTKTKKLIDSINVLSSNLDHDRIYETSWSEEGLNVYINTGTKLYKKYQEMMRVKDNEALDLKKKWATAAAATAYASETLRTREIAPEDYEFQYEMEHSRIYTIIETELFD